jgi:hypothetical protein
MGASASFVLDPFGVTEEAAASLGLPAPRKDKKAKKAAEDQAAQQLDELAALQAKRVGLPSEEAIRKGRRRSIAEQMRRRGRPSTILTNTERDTLGA